jgi:hypothetical protein
METYLFSTNLKTKSQKCLRNIKWGQNNMVVLSQNNLLYLVDILEPEKYNIFPQPANILMLEWSLVGRYLLIVTEDSKVRILHEVNNCVNDLELHGKAPLDMETCLKAKWIKHEIPSFVAVGRNGTIALYQFAKYQKWARMNGFNTGFRVDRVDMCNNEDRVELAMSEENSCTIHIIGWDLKDISYQSLVFTEDIHNFYYFQGDLMIQFKNRIEKWTTSKDQDLTVSKYQYTTCMEEDPLKPFASVPEEWEEYAVSPNGALVAFLHKNKISFYIKKSLEEVLEILKSPHHFYDLSDVYLHLKSVGPNLANYMTEKSVRPGSDILMKNILVLTTPKPSLELILQLNVRIVWLTVKQSMFDRSDEDSKVLEMKFEGSALWMLKLVSFILDNLSQVLEKKAISIFPKMFKKGNHLTILICETLVLLKGMLNDPQLQVAQGILSELGNPATKFGENQLQLDHAYRSILKENANAIVDIKKKIRCENISDMTYLVDLDLKSKLFGQFGDGYDEPTLDCITKEKLSGQSMRKCRFCGSQTNYILDPQGFAMKWKSCCLLCQGLWKRI